MKTISATTVGLVEVIRHETKVLIPLLSIQSACMADSMSASVVPGAKFLASTTKGAADPLMLSPGPDVLGEGLMFAFWLLLISAAIRFARAF